MSQCWSRHSLYRRPKKKSHHATIGHEGCKIHTADLHGQANQCTLPPKPSPNHQLHTSVFISVSGVQTWTKNGSSFKAQVYAPSFLQSHVVWGHPECPAADADCAGGDHSVPPASGRHIFEWASDFYILWLIYVSTLVYIDTYTEKIIRGDRQWNFTCFVLMSEYHKYQPPHIK